MPKKLTAEDYEHMAHWEGDCLVAHGVGIGTARKVYQLRHGILKTEQYVCHTCDNPKCILDAHHWVGSCGDNVRDAVAKGRHASLRSHPGRFFGPHTEASRKKISEAGRHRVVSEETRAKISATERGKVVSEETREKLRARIVTPATRLKQSEALLRYWRNK